MNNHIPPPDLSETEKQAAEYRHQRMLQHIAYLSQTIGGRGSCTPQEKEACQYTQAVMQELGLTAVNLESFQANRSTYLPFALAFGAALLGALVALFIPGQVSFVVAVVLNALGAAGMLAETDLSINWMQWLLPKSASQNAVGVCKAHGDIKKQVVLCAHVDTHRTPVFYSSASWHKAFSLLVQLALASMVSGAILFILMAFSAWGWLQWLAVLIASVEMLAFLLCLHADFTPFSPGANDNATGVAVCLEIANHLKNNPLNHTCIHFTFTGCEEVGAHGMQAFLNQHKDMLDKETIYIIFDEVGLGAIKYLTRDGLVFQHPTHPQALTLARQAASTLPDLPIQEGAGLAYTDALVATQRGLVALTICTLPEPGSQESSHWHQMTDTIEHVDPTCLENVFQFTLVLLNTIDQPGYSQVNERKLIPAQ